MTQFFLIAVAIIGHVWSQQSTICGPMPAQWLSPINLQGPHYAPDYKPLHVFSFLDGGTGLTMENTGDTVRINYPIRFDIHSMPPNLTDVQISRGPLSDKYTASHMEFRWGPAPTTMSSTGPAVESSSSSGGALFLEQDSRATVKATVQATDGAADGAADGATDGATDGARDGATEGATVSFEFGSDHGISGKYYPFELQMYFYDVKFKSFDEAMAASPQQPDHHDVNEDVVALSVLFEVGDQNEELTKITDRLELIRDTNTSTDIIAKMCFEKILRKGRDFITYSGSLTHAPCTRGVRWIVFVESLTLSQEQLDQFRLLSQDAAFWLPPLDHDLAARLIETNLRQLPVDTTKYVPAFHEHGPPVSVINPKVGGTIINIHADNEVDLAYQNYWTPLDYSLAAVQAAAAAAATAPAAASAGGGGGATGTAGSLLEHKQASGASASPAAGIPTTSYFVPPTTTASASTAFVADNVPSDRVVKIPHIFELGSTALFTPDFDPKVHDHSEDNHYHPKSLNDIQDDNEKIPGSVFREISKMNRLQTQIQQAMNPTQPDAKEQAATPNQKRHIKHWKMV